MSGRLAKHVGEGPPFSDMLGEHRLREVFLRLLWSIPVLPSKRN